MLLNEGITLKKNVSILVKEYDRFWAVYKYENIVLSLPNIRNDCLEKLEQYIYKYRNKYYDLKYPKDSITIHWRLGDFIRNNEVIHYESIVQASMLFKNKFKYIYIMDGGSLHLTNSELQSKTENLKTMLKHVLKKTYPDSKIITLHTDPDLDLYIFLFFLF